VILVLASSFSFAVVYVEDGSPKGIWRRNLRWDFLCCQSVAFNSGKLSVAGEDKDSAEFVFVTVEIVAS
jgi:hypothetical protein